MNIFYVKFLNSFPMYTLKKILKKELREEKKKRLCKMSKNGCPLEKTLSVHIPIYRVSITTCSPLQ